MTLTNAVGLYQPAQATLSGIAVINNFADPISFVCGGKSSAEDWKAWAVKRQQRKLDASRTERTLVYSEPGSGLVIRCEAIEYHG